MTRSEALAYLQACSAKYTCIGGKHILLELPTERWEEILSALREPGEECPAAVLKVCHDRNWSLHWTARGAYLHLEASELIEAIRGKHGNPTEEAADVLIVLMSITEHAGIPWDSVQSQAWAKVRDLQTKPPYFREERLPPSPPPAVSEAKPLVTVYSIHGFNLGAFDNLVDAMSQGDGWKIEDCNGKVLLQRMSLEYRDSRWYTPGCEEPFAPPAEPAAQSGERSSWEIAVGWYEEESISRWLQEIRDEAGERNKIPRDTRSPEFAKWLTNEYRMAMDKGIQLGRRAAALAEVEGRSKP